MRSTFSRSTPASAVPINSSPRLAQPLEHGSGRRREKEPFGAPIVGIGTPLDQAAVAKLVEQARQRDRLKVEHFGKLGLLQPLEPVEAHQHDPLGAGHAELAGFLIRIGPEHSSYVIE